MDVFWESLRKEILAEMKSQEVSKADLARRLGWPAPHVSRYLGSDEKPSEPTREPGLDKLNEIAAALNTTLTEFIRRASEQGKKKTGPQVVQAPATRDSLVTRLVELITKMNLAELQTTVNVVEKAMAKRAEKKDPKSTAQAG